MFIPNNYRVSLINPIKKIPTIVNRRGFAERQALEPILSRNIIKLQITDNHILSKV